MIQSHRILIFDFEVFPYDVLLGAIVYDKKGNTSFYQAWDKEEIKAFYEANKSVIWIGHNNESYDNAILDGIINNKNIYVLSKELVKGDRRPKISIPLNTIDLMRIYGSFYSLKMTEGAWGNDISETEVDFDIPRPLTAEEKAKTESYNRDDLNATLNNANSMKDIIGMRLDLCKEFKLPLSYLNATQGQIGAKVLGAKKVPNIENMVVKPIWYDDLKLNDENIKTFYMNEEFRKGGHFNKKVCGQVLVGGNGGLHSALPKYHCDNALYFDVSGYYNLTMINKGLLPRTLDEQGRQRYIDCYHEQLRLKKTNPKKRAVYKTILLAVFGSMLNKYTDFYDPWRGGLVMIVAQLYMLDLLEKLDGKVTLVQTNTDGIIVEPNDWNKRDEVIKIVEEWEKRTGYVIKKVPIHNIWQRDVNCYLYNTEDGKLHIVGENAVYEHWKDPFDRGTWQIKEPPILAYCVVDFLTKGILPETTVETYKNEYRMFQYLCKKGSFDYLEYIGRNEQGEVIEKKKLQNVNRAFAYNSMTEQAMLYKCKNNGSKSKVTSLPPNVFVYNNNINKATLIDKIDYDYYVKRGYEKIETFLDDDIIKELGWGESEKGIVLF